MKCSVSLWIGVRVDLLQGHDVVNGFLHFVRMDAEGRLQQLEEAERKKKRDGGKKCKQIEARNMRDTSV